MELGRGIPSGLSGARRSLLQHTAKGSVPGPHGHLCLPPRWGRGESEDTLHSSLPITVSGAQESTSLSAPLLRLLLVDKSCSRDVSTQASFSLLVTNMCACSVAQLCLTLCGPTRLLCPWDSPGQNSGVGCHALLQGIFPTRGSNPGLPRWQADSEPPGKLVSNVQTSHCGHD